MEVMEKEKLHGVENKNKTELGLWWIRKGLEECNLRIVKERKVGNGSRGEKRMYGLKDVKKKLLKNKTRQD